MQRSAACTKGKLLTKEIVNEIVQVKVAQAKAKLDIMQKHDVVAVA